MDIPGMRMDMGMSDELEMRLEARLVPVCRLTNHIAALPDLMGRDLGGQSVTFLKNAYWVLKEKRRNNVVEINDDELEKIERKYHGQYREIQKAPNWHRVELNSEAHRSYLMEYYVTSLSVYDVLAPEIGIKGLVTDIYGLFADLLKRRYRMEDEPHIYFRKPSDAPGNYGTRLEDVDEVKDRHTERDPRLKEMEEIDTSIKGYLVVSEMTRGKFIEDVKLSYNRLLLDKYLENPGAYEYSLREHLDFMMKSITAMLVGIDVSKLRPMQKWKEKYARFAEEYGDLFYLLPSEWAET